MDSSARSNDPSNRGADSGAHSSKKVAADSDSSTSSVCDNDDSDDIAAEEEMRAMKQSFTEVCWPTLHFTTCPHNTHDLHSSFLRSTHSGEAACPTSYGIL